MKEETYIKKLKMAEKEYIVKINKIHKEYALSNNKVKIGDVVSGSGVRIKVEKIDIYIPFGKKPCRCKYHGPLVTKKGELFKSGGSDWVYEVDN